MDSLQQFRQVLTCHLFLSLCTGSVFGTGVLLSTATSVSMFCLNTKSNSGTTVCF